MSRTSVPDVRSKAEFRLKLSPESNATWSQTITPRRSLAFAEIDGIRTRYEVVGSGPPLLMYAPAGFDASLDKWSTQGVYAKIKLVEHLPKKYTCILFDRRECGQSGGRVERVTWADFVAQGKGL